MQGLQAYYGVEDESLWMLATGLGAGMSRRGFACGAVTGAIIGCGMATALGRSSTREDRRGLREETYSRVQALTRRFEARFGSVDCSAMTGCDFQTAEGQADFKARGLMDGVCRPAVRQAVEAVVELCG